MVSPKKNEIMSDIIRLLPDSVANQIAAGEVIQRPASVVKELVENSIDAGATEIHVLITDAGRTCIQIIDDGKGMSSTDARLSFERHATSKIAKADDLFALRTMGFRGEALASIAAVAQVELKTRRSEDEIGIKISIEDSKVTQQEEVLCSRGTNFKVKNLFYNLPARRKFLKPNKTEFNNILHEFQRIVLIYPQLSFTLHHNDVEQYNLPVSTFRQRIIAVFGKRYQQQLITIDNNTSLVRVHGYVVRPEFARKRGAHQYFFVNNRYMRHPYFYKAVTEAYAKLIPVGEQVTYFIQLEVDPANIDVNIHPTKTEIKFENEHAIWQILLATIKESLGKFNAVPSIDFDVQDMPDIPVYHERSDAPSAPPELTFDPNFNPFNSTGNTKPNSVDGSSYQKVPQSDHWESLYEGITPDAAQEGAAASIELPSSSAPIYASAPEEAPQERSNQHYQYKGRYLLTSVKSGLMMIDQHRAHICVLYHRYMKQLEKQQGVSQGVLFPTIFELTPIETPIFEEIHTDLCAVGFDISSLGGGSYAINGIPTGTEGVDVVQLIKDMLDSVQETSTDIKKEVRAPIALTLAKASAIVYGQVLSAEEKERLIDELFACSSPKYTPDGKKVISVLTAEEINKRF